MHCSAPGPAPWSERPAPREEVPPPGGPGGAGVVGRQAPQRQQVGLLVEAEGVVDAAVQVRGDLGLSLIHI